jgi:hypothetical protein
LITTYADTVETLLKQSRLIHVPYAIQLNLCI